MLNQFPPPTSTHCLDCTSLPHADIHVPVGKFLDNLEVNDYVVQVHRLCRTYGVFGYPKSGHMRNNQLTMLFIYIFPCDFVGLWSTRRYPSYQASAGAGAQAEGLRYKGQHMVKYSVKLKVICSIYSVKLKVICSTL